jgi:hypothetical protein
MGVNQTFLHISMPHLFHRSLLQHLFFLSIDPKLNPTPTSDAVAVALSQMLTHHPLATRQENSRR